MADLYPMTQRAITLFPKLFVVVEPHEVGDPEGSDLLWFEKTPDDEMREGQLISIQHLGGDNWGAAHDQADRYGGWPTLWSSFGLEDKVLGDIKTYVQADIAPRYSAKTQTMQPVDKIGQHLEALGIYDMGDVPGVVWFLQSDGGQPKPDGWQELTGHAYDGFRLDYLNGWVLPLKTSKAVEPILFALDGENFLQNCKITNMDYEVNDEHRAAYKEFLGAHGMEPGDLLELYQAVLPLAPTVANLHALGIESLLIPPGATLLVLGWNCD